MKKIFRNDDTSAITPVNQFRFVHEIFKSFGVTHTVAVIVKDIDKNKELVDYILENKSLIDLQLHCWEHFDHSKLEEERLKEFFELSIDKMQKVFNVTPTIFYPPWNRVSDLCIEVAERFKLTVRPDKISLNQYIRKDGDVVEDTINFHGWFQEEVNSLYTALEIYKNKQ